MKKKPAVIIAISTLCVALVAVAWIWHHDRNLQKGERDARADLKANKLAIETVGLSRPSDGEYERLLKERYGIEVKTVAGCLVGPDILNHMETYNGPMKAEIARRFGINVFDRTREEAERNVMAAASPPPGEK